MEAPAVRFLTIGTILIVLAMPGGAGAEQVRSGWYVGAGIGASWTSTINQEGWNRDTYCYPDSCDEPGLSKELAGVSIPGYRWKYDLDTDTGSAFEISIGRYFNRLRLEFTAALQKNDIDQQFSSITFLDGRLNSPPPGNRVTANFVSRIDDFLTRSVSFNAYYDFTDAFDRITPYLGIGLGAAFAEVSGVYYSTNYQALADPSRDLSFYDSSQDTDMTDTVLFGNIHAGADYRLSDRILAGLKLTYSIMDDIKYTGSYLKHPVHREDPDFANHTKFSDIQQWSVMVTLKYLLGR